jgi:uncharacterized protein
VDNTFYDLISESAGNLVSGTELLAEMLSSTVDRKDLAARMRKAEHESDETTHAIIRKVNTTFVTPFDREDIYRLASGLDDVMDYMEEAVDLVNLYGCDELPSGVAKQVDVLQRSAEVTAEAMPKLRSMRDLESYWIEVNRLENEGDKAYRRILAKLFNGSYEALMVMKLKDVVDALEKAIDAFESVANIVEQIAVKES